MTTVQLEHVSYVECIVQKCMSMVLLLMRQLYTNLSGFSNMVNKIVLAH